MASKARKKRHTTPSPRSPPTSQRPPPPVPPTPTPSLPPPPTPTTEAESVLHLVAVQAVLRLKWYDQERVLYVARRMLRSRGRTQSERDTSDRLNENPKPSSRTSSCTQEPFNAASLMLELESRYGNGVDSSIRGGAETGACGCGSEKSREEKSEASEYGTGTQNREKGNTGACACRTGADHGDEVQAGITEAEKIFVVGGSAACASAGGLGEEKKRGRKEKASGIGATNSVGQTEVYARRTEVQNSRERQPQACKGQTDAHAYGISVEDGSRRRRGGEEQSAASAHGNPGHRNPSDPEFGGSLARGACRCLQEDHLGFAGGDTLQDVKENVHPTSADGNDLETDHPGFITTSTNATTRTSTAISSSEHIDDPTCQGQPSPPPSPSSLQTGDPKIPPEVIREKIAELRRENSRLKARHTCRNCRSRPANLTLLPCGHFCLCVECGSTFSKCPVCLETVLADVKTFVS